MAKIYPGFGDGFRGKFNGVSVYKMKGVDELIVRKSGGHSKEKQKSDPKLDLFCRAGKEFGGRSVLVSQLKWAVRLHNCCSDHNVTATLNSRLKPVQELDRIGEWGKRSIYLSQHKQYIKGFQLNRKHSFDSVVTLSPECTIDRATLTAILRFPAMIPGVNFSPAYKSPFFRFIATLTAVPDVVWKDTRYWPAFDSNQYLRDADARSNWFSLLEGSPAFDMELRSDNPPPNEDYTLVVTVGVCYGILKTLDEVEMLPYGGSGKIIEVG